MDASASPKSNSDKNDVFGFFLIHDSTYPPSRQRNTVIKYTKLPDLDFDSKVAWPKKSYTLQPRLRRIITLDDQELKTSRSLKPEQLAVSQIMNAGVTKRKIVTIAEVDEPDLHPNFSKDSYKRPSPVKTSSRSAGPNFKEDKETPRRTSSRISNSSNYSKEVKSNAKMSNAYNRNEVSLSRVKNRTRPPNTISDNNRMRSFKEKDTMRNSKNANAPQKISISKNILFPKESDKEMSIIKNKPINNSKSYVVPKKDVRTRTKSPTSQNRTKVLYMKEIQMKNKPVSVIHVPLDERYQSECHLEESQISQTTLCLEEKARRDCATETQVFHTICKDENTGTDPLPITVDHITQMENNDIHNSYKSVEHADTQTELLRETYDSLDIPNVSLLKDRSAHKDEEYAFNSKSLPNLTDTGKAGHDDDKENKSDVSSSSEVASYVLSRAILTYTTRRKVDVHVLGSKDTNDTNQSSSPLSYPMKVLSVFKAEINNHELNDVSREKRKSDVETATGGAHDRPCNYSYILNSNKLMKPSDLIRSINGSGLLQSDYITEQFHKELNFIDSFFESLQYLENSLTDNCLKDNNIESLVNNSQLELKSPDYAAFLSKFDNGANMYDTETMASKSLCLLNLLIRDEQRRAKNLLFVLKMREDALKDFTKSQILWLEKKKKQDNTDISTLKKKQRGALVKLQHECGEMQRMRKALLTLSEKRKVALMKTKKNIELKLNNNVVDVEKILLGKKKLKSSSSADRNVAPVKCFDLSSSGCEDSSTSRAAVEGRPPPPAPPPAPPATSAEKSIQTTDTILGTVLVDHSTDTAAENFIVVDGGYLNILFHNLSLPKIFSSKRQYEVNEEALKHILHSANSNHNNFKDSDVVEKLMDQIKNCDVDRSSSPSTAHSLVEEFDQYYKGLAEQETSPVDSELDSKGEVCEVGTLALETEDRGQQAEAEVVNCSEEADLMEGDSWGEERTCDGEASELRVSGPLPVPAGATATADPPASPPTWLLPKSSPSTTLSDTISVSSQPLCLSSATSLASPAHGEAEELRRQQLAIEREIKALEQQQCQLLVVREIPDKPPPPYTPPVDSRTPRPSRPFRPDEVEVDKIEKYLSEEAASLEPADSFEMLVKDYCRETLDKHCMDQTDKPWDSCNLLPQKQPIEHQKLIEKTASDLKEVFTVVPPTVVTGVSARRADHIDDILFAEWRRCEPEWTSLHTDEAIVKNQIFESIFQKILTETVDEYKKTVQCNPADGDD